MDTEKIGKTIRELRLGKEMTQATLAGALGVTVQAVSKWERGWGLPDVTLLAKLSDVLGFDLKNLLQGRMEENESGRAAMRNIHVYVCPLCENSSFSTSEVGVTCCGRIVERCEPQAAKEAEKMSIEQVEDEWYISSGHPMTKEDHISFSAIVMNGKFEVLKHYAEWKMERRIPQAYRGTLLWYSEKAGLLFQKI